MNNEVTGTAKRAARVALGTAVAGTVAQLTGNPLWLGLAPLLAALGKLLRSVFGLNYIPF